MKKLLIITMLLITCNQTYMADAQKHKKADTKEHLQDAWDDLKKSNDSTAMLLSNIKRLAAQKIIYRTKIITIHDTTWRIDTCIALITPIDSATIAIIFKNREVTKPTAVGRIIRYILHKKNKEKN